MKATVVRVLGEVVKIVELKPIRAAARDFSGDLHLRIEVLKLGVRRYTTRVWKLEFYRVLPSFQQRRKATIVADEQVLVPFDSIIEKVEGSTAAKVLAETLKQLRERFG